MARGHSCKFVAIFAAALRIPDGMCEALYAKIRARGRRLTSGALKSTRPKARNTRMCTLPQKRSGQGYAALLAIGLPSPHRKNAVSIWNKPRPLC